MALKQKTKEKLKRALALGLSAVMVFSLCAFTGSSATAYTSYSETGTSITAISLYKSYKYVKLTSKEQFENYLTNKYDGPTVKGMDSKTGAAGARTWVSNKRGRPDNWDPNKFGFLILTDNKQYYFSKTHEPGENGFPRPSYFGYGAFSNFNFDADVQYLSSLEDLPVLIPRDDYSYGGSDKGITFNLVHRVNGSVDCNRYVFFQQYGALEYQFYTSTEENRYTFFDLKWYSDESGDTGRLVTLRRTDNGWDGYLHFNYTTGTFKPFVWDDEVGSSKFYFYFAYEATCARVGGTSAPSWPVTYKIGRDTTVKTPDTAAVTFLDKKTTLNVYGNLVIDNDFYCLGTLNVYGNVIIKDGGCLHTSFNDEYGTVNVFGNGTVNNTSYACGSINVCKGGTLSVETFNTPDRLNLYNGNINVDGTMIFCRNRLESGLIWIGGMAIPLDVKKKYDWRIPYFKCYSTESTIMMSSASKFKIHVSYMIDSTDEVHMGDLTMNSENAFITEKEDMNIELIRVK